MKYIVILICALLSCTKVTTQGFVAKGNVKSTADSVFANCLVFGLVSVIFSLSVRNGINTDILMYALFFGVFSSAFQIFYALALKSGPFSATCMLINLSMVVNVVYSFLYYDEGLSAVKIAGVILCFFALFLNTRSDGKRINLKWITYVIIAFVSTGGIGITQKTFAKSKFSGDAEQLVFLGYLIAFIVTLILVLIQRLTKQERNFKMTGKNFILLIVVASTLGIYQNLKTYGDSFIDAIVLNPCISGLATTMQMISGKVIFKEKFGRKRLLSVFIGILAILLISL